MSKSVHRQEKVQIVQAVFYPLVFLFIMWMLKTLEWAGDWHWGHYGLLPRTYQGLLGIVTMPFLHSSWQHLISNSVPFFFLGSILFFFYKELAWRVLLFVWLIGGLWLWIGGGTGYHIGASGVVYGLAAFLFFSGVWRRNSVLLRLTLVVAFIYGGLVWGFFPEFFPNQNISWEGHLFGFLSGMVLAWFFRHQGPPDDQYHWDDSDVPDGEDAYWRSEHQGDPKDLSEKARPTRIRYSLRQTKK